jgi:hypothetical protein
MCHIKKISNLIKKYFNLYFQQKSSNVSYVVKIKTKYKLIFVEGVIFFFSLSFNVIPLTHIMISD